ncbi:methyl-accepting chemotaxis protein [Hahella ganghwensis]|uniref:methyl-accepting chemotaxis protein n=1 Tax=Hahella ganghwensis TaxID=286420 RepID=UPI00036A031E|nr:methyl-accepting chemotaxis protein [Hahella ganghwensis]
MHLTIRQKLLLLAILPILVISVGLTIANGVQMDSLSSATTQKLSDSVQDAKRGELKTVLQLVYSQIKDNYEGAMGRSKMGQQLAIEQLKKITYQEGNHLFAYRSDGSLIFKGSELEGLGQSFIDAKDANGNLWVQNLIQAAKSGDGYSEARFALEDGGESQRLYYSIWLEQWDMVLGTSVDLDDMHQAIGELAAFSEQQVATGLASTITLVVVIGIIVIGLGLVLTRSITKPLSTITASIEQIAAGGGDLTQRVKVSGKDELTRLASQFNTFLDSLQQLVRMIAETSGNITNETTESSQRAGKVSQAISGQRESTELVATAVNELTATAANVSENAEHAAEASLEATSKIRSASSTLEQSADKVKLLAEKLDQANAQINSLESSVGEIGGILDVISGIAEQTNLLALNAAIEAARAGEQGRGFAVVADEVRGLASRTAASTEEIKEKIARLTQESQAAVKLFGEGKQASAEAVTLSQEANAVLVAVVEAIEKISEHNQMIATAATEQNSVAEDINQQIHTIAEAANDAASLAEQNNATAQTVAADSQSLQDQVGQFRV